MTNLQLITDALRAIGVLTEGQSPSAEQGADSMRRLNKMLARWGESDMGFPSWFAQTSIAAACPIPEWAESAVIDCLAMDCAPDYVGEVSLLVARSAEEGEEFILRRQMNQKLTPVDANLPRGEAWR